MPGVENERSDSADLHQKPGGLGQSPSLFDIESLVDSVTFQGQLALLIAFACEKGLIYQVPSHADPGQAPHPGVQAAIRAFDAWKHTEGQKMATDIGTHSDQAKPLADEPETLPLSLAGKWVAWSSDGMRIIASSESSEEAEQLAIASGEPEPILERHPGRYRL